MLSEAAIHAWQFSQPRGTAVDKSNNNVYVVDRDNNILNSDLLQHLSGLHLENLPGGGGRKEVFKFFGGRCICTCMPSVLLEFQGGDICQRGERLCQGGGRPP